MHRLTHSSPRATGLAHRGRVLCVRAPHDRPSWVCPVRSGEKPRAHATLSYRGGGVHRTDRRCPRACSEAGSPTGCMRLELRARAAEKSTAYLRAHDRTGSAVLAEVSASFRVDAA